MDEKQELINKMLSLIMKSSHLMPDLVFADFIKHSENKGKKIIYNLVADAYLTLFSYCRLVFDNAWSQAFALLRVGLEQAAAISVFAKNTASIEKYIDLKLLKCKFDRIESKEERQAFLKEHGITQNRSNCFFDYSWISSFTSNEKYGRDQLLELANLNEFLVDIDNSLNAFSHGSISIFQMDGDGWSIMRKYVRRASYICCKLFDFLCCSYYKLIGEERFSKMSINGYFRSFKLLYCYYIENK